MLCWLPKRFFLDNDVNTFAHVVTHDDVTDIRSSRLLNQIGVREVLYVMS